MDPEACEQSLQQDLHALKEMVLGFSKVEADVQWAMDHWSPQARGYFTPDEDDRLREMLLAYRGHRRTCYELMDRWREHESDTGAPMPIEAFAVAYAAALALYARSLHFIRSFESSPLIRTKINEPDPKLDVPAGFFDELIEAFCAPSNLWALSRAHWRWHQQRRALHRLGQAHPETYGWVLALIPPLQRRVRKQFALIWSVRLRRDLRAALRLLLAPLRHGGSRLGGRVARALAGKGSGRSRTLSHRMVAHLTSELRTGDILLVRAEGKLTTSILPGFWAHAALYIRHPDDLATLGIADHPYVLRHQNAWPKVPSPAGYVLEAISPRVLIRPLEATLRVDHVAVLRPRLEPEALGQALAEAFGHLGKPYDFGFDFNVSHCIVCTELIYRAFHLRGPITIDLIKRAGRFTLTGDDLVDIALSRSIEPWFEGVGLVLTTTWGRPRVVAPSSWITALTQLRAGWRPLRDPWPASLEVARD